MTFDEDAAPAGSRYGLGVTAWTPDDAMAVAQEALGTDDLRPSSVDEDIDVSTRDAGHVLPNMSPPNERGVWYPMGLAQAR